MSPDAASPTRIDAAEVRECDVVVLGATLSGFVAAWELSSVGLNVVVVDVDSDPELDPAAPTAGPAAQAASRLARTLDLSLSASTDAENNLRECLEKLDLAGSLHAYPAVNPALARPGSTPVSLGYPNLLGIPASPLDRQVGNTVGAGASFRAYLDRLMPVLTIGKEQYLGGLVRRRVGGMLAERVVAPLVLDRFGVHLDDLEVAAALPGINEAITRTGSLTGAVLARHNEQVARETTYAVRGGFGELAHRLGERIGFFTTPVIAGIPVALDCDPTRVGPVWALRLADETTVAARAVVVASILNLDPIDEAGDSAENESLGSEELLFPGMVTGIAPAPTYSVFVIRCESAVLETLPPYTVATEHATNIRRVERVSLLWPESVTDPSPGYETLRIIRTPDIARVGTAELAGELGDLLGVDIPESALIILDAETLPLPRDPAIILEPGAREAATTADPRPGFLRVPIWPVEGTLSDTIGLTRRAVVPLRRSLVGLT
ncbi:hypothetical protein GCM10022198_03050 [Klugiella xanthotipulae]|uniref:Oxygen-dependent protoporphyrinogen oxidase n=1 Tax=Klugiella xanthotipulae TaxID=244735 RepID=A0A543I782_9MICO|nr:hypothetical protein [Klugiella xanthotipulae]TQM66399.1 hypothetical protein FB466_1239 [Klugiella xanthotipulae]